MEDVSPKKENKISRAPTHTHTTRLRGPCWVCAPKIAWRPAHLSHIFRWTGCWAGRRVEAGCSARLCWA